MARRNRNEGSIFERKDGRWAGVLSLGWQGRRVRKYFYGATAQEVQDKLLKARADAAAGLPIAPERQTVSQFLAAYLDSIRDKVRPRTLERFEGLVRLHIAPALGSIRLDKLSPQHIQRLLDAKIAEGLSAQSVVHVRNLLRLAFNRAVRWNMIPRNPALLVDVPSIRRAPVRYLSLDEAQRLLDAAKGERLEALYVVALCLGLRRGEALGLKWDDLDLDAGRLTVRRAVQRLPDGVKMVETKTAKGNRTVPLPQFAVQALREHRRRQAEERLFAGRRWRDLGLVFCNRSGSLLDPMTLYRDFRRMLTKAGLPPMRFHDLRHSAAAFMLSQGVALKVIQEILGHSSLAVTAGFYAHVGDALKREAAAAMDALLTGATGAKTGGF